MSVCSPLVGGTLSQVWVGGRGGNPSKVWMVGGGTPSQVWWWGRGYPIPGLMAGGYPFQVWWWGGTPSQVWMVGGTQGTPPARSWWWGGTWGTPHDWMGYSPTPTSIASTCYAAGGMPLAFTHEDLLVFSSYHQMFHTTPPSHPLRKYGNMEFWQF